MSKIIPQSNIIKISDSHSVVIDREAEIKEGDKFYSEFLPDYPDKILTSLTDWEHRDDSYKILFTIGVAIPGITLLVEQEEMPDLSFAIWYSGMDKDKVESAYLRFVKERGFRAARSKGTFTQEQVQLLLFKARTITHQHKSVDELISESHPPIKEIIIEEATAQKAEGDPHIFLEPRFQPRYFDEERNTITCKFVY